MTRNRNRNIVQNTFKDYLVPIVGGVILLVLLFSVFGGDDSKSPQASQTTENTSSVGINFMQDNTQAFIVYPGDESKEIQDRAALYKGESIIVREGIIQLSFENNNSVALNKVAELKYNEDSSLSLFSSDAWINLGSDTNISMRYANLQAPAGSILSLTQNEASSTIYVLSGSAKVTNLGGASTSMIQGQKLSISRQFAADEEADLSGDKGVIDSYFKSSDWFIENEGFTVLDNLQVITDSSSTTDTGTGTIQGDTGVFLQFDTIRDEGNISGAQISISGNTLSEDVALITIDGSQAAISEDGSFSLENVNVGQSVNDIVIKIYDDNRAILDKKVITLYNSNPSASVSNTSNVVTQQVPQNTQAVETVVNSQGVTTFGVDATDFAFTAPSSSNEFTTTIGEITIRGITTAENISKVEVNGFELASFNGSTWRYHAFERFETLEAGTNQYKVDYYGENGSIVYTNYYTIVKRDAEPVIVAPVAVPEDTETEAEETEVSDIPDEETLFQ